MVARLFTEGAVPSPNGGNKVASGSSNGTVFQIGPIFPHSKPFKNRLLISYEYRTPQNGSGTTTV